MTIEQIIERVLSVPWPEDYKTGVRAALDADGEKYRRERDARLLAMPCSRRVN